MYHTSLFAGDRDLLRQLAYRIHIIPNRRKIISEILLKGSTIENLNSKPSLQSIALISYMDRSSQIMLGL